MTRQDAISAAGDAAFDRDRLMIVGEHPHFGWVYRDAEDFGGIAELTDTVQVDGFGAVQVDDYYCVA